MSVSGTMRRRITPRAWACSAAPSRSRTSACAVRIGRGPRRSASATLSPSTQLAVRYANVPTTPAAYTWRIAGWSRAASVSVSRRNQARPGESGARCTCRATERFSTRSHAWYTARSGVAATRWSRRYAGVRARTTSSSRSAGGDGWLIAPPNLTASAEPDLHRRPAVGARTGCVVAHIPQRYVDTAVARIHRRRKEPRELRDRPALRGDERRVHRGVVEVPSDGPPSSRDAVRRSGEPLPAEGSPHDGERRPLAVGAEPLCRGGADSRRRGTAVRPRRPVGGAHHRGATLPLGGALRFAGQRRGTRVGRRSAPRPPRGARGAHHLAGPGDRAIRAVPCGGGGFEQRRYPRIAVGCALPRTRVERRRLGDGAGPAPLMRLDWAAR